MTQHHFSEEIPILYDRFHHQLFDTVLPVHIFGTGSSGNSVYLKRIHTLIDLGLPYKRYREYDPNFFLDVDRIILTHEHGDHLNPATLMKILDMYPNVSFIIHPRMAKALISDKFKNKIDRDALLSRQDRFQSAAPAMLTSRDGFAFAFQPHLTRHGPITNIAIEMTTPKLGIHLLYASDLDSLEPDPTGLTDGLPHDMNHPFDLLFLEANYDEALLNEALRRDPDDIRARGNLRHISEQAAWRYVERYLDDRGVFIPLHASRQFGTLIQAKPAI